MNLFLQGGGFHKGFRNAFQKYFDDFSVDGLEAVDFVENLTFCVVGLPGGRLILVESGNVGCQNFLQKYADFGLYFSTDRVNVTYDGLGEFLQQIQIRMLFFY